MIERIIVDPLRTNCYIYSSVKNRCIIIDPGGQEQEIISSIDMLNLIPEGIVFTHGHFDHTAAAGKLKEYYTNRNLDIRLAIHEMDREYLGKTARNRNERDFNELGFSAMDINGDIYSGLPEADIILHEGDSVFDTNLTVIETPGHTRGSICLFGESEHILFSGDTIFFEGIGRADLPGGDEQTLINSIKEKILVLPGDTRIFPGHGPLTSIERELKGNPFII
ncbi:MAG: MBL fold metallo-hydrolase [Spirochaetes bacterium]|nr:MBL fold metallo-hydrolase [Spirochaetota bacterium]